MLRPCGAGEGVPVGDSFPPAGCRTWRPTAGDGRWETGVGKIVGENGGNGVFVKKGKGADFK